LTVAIVTRPFTFEGRNGSNSVEGLSDLKDAVDSIIIVSNDKLLMSSGNAPISQAFKESDRILAQSVKTVPI
jgi:cell division protein FtsZ